MSTATHTAPGFRPGRSTRDAPRVGDAMSPTGPSIRQRAATAVRRGATDILADVAHHQHRLQEEGHVEHAKRELRAAQAGRSIVDTMLVIVIAVVVGFVGIKATSETDSAINVASGSQYQNASDALSSGFTSAMSLTEIVFIVLMLAVVVAALIGLRGRR